MAISRLAATRLPRPLARAALGLFSTLRTVAGMAALYGSAIVVGVTSSWYAINTGLPITTERVGPWVQWMHVGDTDTDPYTRARLASLGSVVFDASRVARYEARVDNDGRRLHSSCIYEIDSAPLAARWWTIAVFDAKGALIPNPAQRFGFNTANVARDGRGHFKIVLARDAAAGNWLPTASAGRMVIVLEAFDPAHSGADGSGGLVPPGIRRTSC